jgi:hypothetical protein
MHHVYSVCGCCNVYAHELSPLALTGWVEFADKKIAKAVALTLNNTAIGGKKHGFYHDDIWNIKYLKGFKWTNLTEQIGMDSLAHTRTHPHTYTHTDTCMHASITAQENIVHTRLYSCRRTHTHTNTR